MIYLYLIQAKKLFKFKGKWYFIKKNFCKFYYIIFFYVCAIFCWENEKKLNFDFF